MNEEERFFIRQHPTVTLCIIQCRICSVERGYNYDSDDEWHMYSLVEFMEAHRHVDMVSPTVKQGALPLEAVKMCWCCGEKPAELPYKGQCLECFSISSRMFCPTCRKCPQHCKGHAA